MSLRLRLVVYIGLALTLLWGASAAWMWRDASQDLQRMLDDRLAMSAHMVAGLLSRQLAFEDDAEASGVADVLVTVPAGRGMACQIRSMRGKVIASTAGTPGALSKSVKPGYDTRVINGTAWRTFTLQVNGLSITTADRVAGREMLRRQIALTVGIPFLIAAIGGLLVLWYGTTRGLKPLRRLRRDVSRRGPDAFDPLETANLPRELKPLAETLNHLLHRTDQAMQRERHFTNDAAHELRTPLTAISTHLQVARMNANDPAQVALVDAEAGVARMQATLEQLLLLARVEGRLPFDEDDGIDAATALDRAVADSGAANANRRVAREEHGADSILGVASSLAVVALRNLIDNALQHSGEDSVVTVTIESDSNTVYFRVLDLGPGLDGDPAHVTQRFWRSGTHHGSGLGLTIVEAIAQRYGGRLKLLNRNPGLEARLALPRL